jgi:UDP-N-acetylmuramoyl-L-alanyl-D-glutamate--2,6-diaminopimelate ligase
MQVVCDVPFTVVVDFAHTPDGAGEGAGRARAGAGRASVGGRGRRRRTRSRQARARSARSRPGADLAVFTEEDHRSEDLGGILAAMAAGARAAGGVEGASFHVVPDRRAAIALALRLAAPGDVVLLAGKGHERTLERGADGHPVGRGRAQKRARPSPTSARSMGP